MQFWSRSHKGEKDDPRTGVRRESLCLPAILQAGFQQAPEAESSPDLSLDHSVITTGRINTRVVKVKWCYVVRCYWTRPVKIHDADTLFRPPLAPAAGRDPAVFPRRGSSVEASLGRWSISAQPCWKQQLSTVSDTIWRTIWYQEGVCRRAGRYNATESRDSYYLASLFNIRAAQYMQISNR